MIPNAGDTAKHLKLNLFSLSGTCVYIKSKLILLQFAIVNDFDKQL